MKILVTAFACSPCYGSEHYVGWSWIKAIARDHEVWLLCGDKEVANIEKARKAGEFPEGIREVISPGKPIRAWNSNRFLSRLQTWSWPIEFERDVARMAPALHRRIGFDLCHAVTIASWRMPSGLRALKIPFVRGPMGGGEAFPIKFLPTLGTTGKLYETIRYVSDILASSRPAIRASLQSPGVIIATNQSTVARLAKMGRTRPVLVCPNLLSRSRFEAICRTAERVEKASELRIFGGGSAEGRKGIAIFLRVAAALRDRGIKFRAVFGGSGPELPFLTSLKSKLNLDDLVTFRSALGGEEYLEMLCRSHVFLFPSLRDNGPITLLEAMSAGMVPVVVNNGGPGEVVTQNNGFKFEARTPDLLVKEMATAVSQLERDRNLLSNLAVAARARVRKTFLFDSAKQVLSRAYDLALEGNSTRTFQEFRPHLNPSRKLD